MTRLSHLLAGAAMLALLPATPASAVNTKSWVASTGSDANDCSLAHPCATFAHAMTATSAGGEVNVVNGGDFGPLVISKAIHIANDGAGTATSTFAPF